jgi:hypothetical protein
MANGNPFIYFFIALTLSNCNPDTLDTVSFEINNQYDKTIEVKFAGYSVKGHQPSDTVFVILSGEKSWFILMMAEFFQRINTL